MLTLQTQKAIIKNIQTFDAEERKNFIIRLTEETYNEDDLIDMIKVKEMKDYEDLDTIVRDQYINAFLKMHIS